MLKSNKIKSISRYNLYSSFEDECAKILMIVSVEMSSSCQPCCTFDFKGPKLLSRHPEVGDMGTQSEQQSAECALMLRWWRWWRLSGANFIPITSQLQGRRYTHTRSAHFRFDT